MQVRRRQLVRSDDRGGVDDPVLFRISVLATPLEVRRGLEVVNGLLEAADFDPATLGDVQLLLGEVLNNIAEHAFTGRMPGDIQLVARRDGPEMRFTVRDWGDRLPGGVLPEGRQVDVSGPLADLPEGGFGWNMIHALASRVEYRRSNGENRLLLWLPTGAK